MDVYRIVIALLFLHFSQAQYNPLKDPNICGRPQCEDGGKFKYLQNTEYSYKYAVHVSSLFVGTSRNESVLRINAGFRIHFPTRCEGTINFHSVKLEDENGSESPKSSLFAEAIEKYTLRFAFHDGYINEVCSEDNEPSWVLNFKKGLLSAFQNTMVRFDMDHNVLESDISGKCDTVYRLQGAKKTSLSIEKVRDLQTCTHRYTHHSILQTTPYEFRQNFQAWPVLNSTSICEQSIDHHIYNSIICEEKHIFRPFSNQEAGATTITKQYITLVSETKIHDMMSDSTDSENPISHRSKLYFDHVPSSKPTHGELKISRDFLKKLCQLGTDEIQREYTDAFTGFIQSAKALSHTALSQVLARADSICPTGRSHMLETLPYIGSTASVQLMRDEMLIKNKIPEEKVRSWMWSFAFIQRPSTEILEAMKSLLEQNIDEAIFPLSVSSLLHSFCKYSHECMNAPVVQELIQMIENQVMRYRNNLDGRENIEKMLILLKAIGNAGIVSDEFSDTLLDIVDDPIIPLVVRLAGVDAHRRLSCPKTREFFIELLKNQELPSELRIAAYQQVMRCPNYLVINTIKNALDVEEVNQVGSFIWSHLHNLVKSANPAKIEVQGLLSDQLLGQKFNGGIRKFSRNYEYSVFFEDYNVGGSFESNVIFSTESYIPRSVLLNVTVDVCGESLNLFELSTRLEGFEHYTESLFGPRGPLSSEKVKEVVRTQVDKIANIRFPRQASQESVTEEELKNSINKLPYKLDYNYNEPKLSLGLKIFGNDLQHLNYVGNDEIKNVANAMNPMTYVHKFLSGEEIIFKKAGVFLDASYSVPTYTGFPLNLKVHGASGIDFRMVGSLQADNFLETKRMNLKGNVIPSVTVDVVGTMEVDAYFASTGIKLKTNLYSSSAVEVVMVVDGPKLVSLELSLPKEKTEIFSARSELVVVQNEVDKLQTGYDNFIDGSSCSWPVFNKAIGLEFCANYTLPNVTKVESAPSFILSGPVRFNIALHKADPTAKKYVFEYKWENLRNISYVSFIFNTPNSEMKRLLGANLTLADDSKNLTMMFQSEENIFRAYGLYKNNYDSIVSNITLDINGNKHLDAYFEWTIKNETHGHSYTPKLYLAVNNEKVAELTGLLKVVTKKNISQYDIRLRFETKRLAAVLMGYVTDSDASTSTKLRLDYKFLESKLENVKVEGSLSNLSDRNRTHRRGEFKLETTAYPQYNFVSAFTFINHLGHVDCKVDINTSKNLTDPNHTLTIHSILLLNNSYDTSKYSAQISVFKPISRLDVGLQVLYEKMGFQHHGWVAVKYAPTKEIIGDIDVSYMRSPNLQADGKFNLSIPSFVPFVIEGSLAEKSHKEYVINLNACWFTGHTMRARALYNDNSTASRTSHYLKVHIKSPSDPKEHQEVSHEVDINCRYHNDKKELRFDLQVSHNNDRYGMLLKHLETSSSSMLSYLKLRYKTQIYSIASTIETEHPNKQMLLDIHLDQIRDIHIALRGINGNMKKEYGVEVKWDANRDPGQKAVLSIEMQKPKPASLECGFVLSYPGRTVTGSLGMEAVVSQLSDNEYKLSSRVMWSPQDEVSFYVVAGYGFQPGIHTKFLIDLYTPFEHWSRTALHLGFLLHQNLFHVNGSVLWESNQQIAIDIFGDYEITTDSFRCTYNSSLTSTIKNVPSLSAFLKHKHNYTRVDTEINVKYNPGQVISIVSGWQLDRELKADTLSGTVTIHSPFKGYGRGLLVCRITLAHNRTLHGAAELDLDSKKYTLVMKGHLQKITNNMLNFNITTPIQKYRLLTGRFGFSEEHRHAVAEIRGPTDGIGLELLLDIHTTTNFDLKFHLATPFEQVKDIMLVGKLKKEEIDFRVGWNALVLGFAGVWRYNMLTDMEYSYKFFIPLEHFEENGVVVKIINTNGLDVELSVQLSDKKIGIKAIGKPNPVPLYREFGFKRPLLFEPIREDEDEDEDEEDETEESEDLSNEDYESWSALLELDTIVYPTMKGMLDYEKIDTIQSFSGSMTLEQGVIELRDDFQMLDVFTMRNQLLLTTPFKIAEEITSKFDFRIEMGEKYLLDVDMNVLNYNETQQGRLLLNYTIKDADDDNHLKTQYAAVQLKTPIKNLSLVQAKMVLETQDGMYRVNVTAKTSRSEASFAGNLEMFKDYLEATGGLRLASDHLNIPMVTFLAKKDFSEIERRLELGFNIWENNTWQKFDIETTWHVESNKYINMKVMLETPIESVSKIGCSVLLSRTSTDIPTASASLELNYKDHEVTVNAGRRGPHVTFELTTPLDEFRNISFTGKLEPGHGTAAADAEAELYDLAGILRSGPRSYKVQGEVIILEPLPLKINVELIPQQEGEPKTLQYVLARTPAGHAITARMDSGKRYLAVSGEAAIRDKFDWDLGLHIDSSVTILRNLNLRSRLRTLKEDRITFDIEMTSPIKKLSRSNVTLDMALTKEKGNFKATYGLENSQGSLVCSWIYFLMKDMRISLNAEQHFKDRNSKSVSVSARYLNPSTTGRKLENLTVGADLDIDHLWKVGSNISIAMASFQDAKLDVGLRLPPPNSDLHHASCLYKSENDPRAMNLKLLYETDVSESHYAADVKMLKSVSTTNDSDTKAIVNLGWGTKRNKKFIGNNLHLVQEKDQKTQLKYNLTTPKYKEETVVASLLYNKDDYFKNVSASLNVPASHHVVSGNVDYHSLDSMRGIFNSSTPIKGLPWLGGKFRVNSDEKGDHLHFVRLLWPNNSALLDSKYSSRSKDSTKHINGTLLIELPLTTRHLLYSDYKYNVEPSLIKGAAILKYNNKTFLNADYKCKSENRVGYDKDDIVLTLENKHTPVGINYIHIQQYDLLRNSDMKRVEVYQLFNRTGFNITGELHMRKTPTGRRLELLAVHTNRTVRLKTEHDIKDRELEHRSRLELAKDVWLAYKLRLFNYTKAEQESQKFELDVSYPRRNISAIGSYHLTGEYLKSEATLTWDRNVSLRTMTAGLDWRSVPAPIGEHQTATLTFKHPSFEKDVTFRGELRRHNDRELLFAKMFVEYCNDPNSLVEMSGVFYDNSEVAYRNYSYEILAVHKATQLDLDVRGSVYGQPGFYKTFNHGQYRRSYLPLQQGEIEGMLDVPGMEIILQKINMLATSRLWCRMGSDHPYYTVNGTLKNRDIDAIGEFYFNTDDKLVRMEVNMTPDASQSMHMFGTIPDARSASFDIWRDYEDIRVSDVAFYLRLNHSRLVTGELTWRPKIKQDIKGLLRFTAVYIYDSLSESADYWRQYIRTETMDAIKDIWQDSEPYIQTYLDDLEGLKVLEQDFEEFRVFLNESYHADDFYIQDIVGFFSYIIDELAIRSPIESLPDIVNEIWEIMGESGQALRKSILWLIETAKASYKKAVELISKILHGDSMAEVTAILESIVEKYDKFIKDLHVSFIKYMEHLWIMTNEYIEYHWKKTIQSLEPSFIKFVHYVETIVWKVSREVLDFLYIRTNEIVESPYFAKFSNFTQDLDHIYRDLTGNDIFSNIYKYSKRIWNFLCDKYFRLIPFSKELQEVVDEIVQEFQQLKELPSLKYLIERIGEVNDRVTWFFDYFEVKARLQHAFKLIRMKLTEITQTALQTENRYREAKTKFIFDPETGLMKLEQKLPMSWQAFNETPKFEEIPEFKAVTNLQSYFQASNTTFWTLYNEYKPYTEPSTWLPPFKAHAMVVGGSYFMTFDKRFAHFDGECSYLLAHDFLDGNFSVALGAPQGQESSRRLYIRTAGKLVTVDMSTKHIHVFSNGIRSTRLPVYFEDTLLYRDADVFIIESELGYTIECNLKYDVCTVKLAGWYFGKTSGLLGTMNNEPSDDIKTSQKLKPKSLHEWAQSWDLGVEKCNQKSVHTEEISLNNVHQEISELCDGLFKNKVSIFSTCFGIIDAEPFYKICINQARNTSGTEFTKKAACSAAVAYQQMCTLQHIPLRIPDICVQCELINGTRLREGVRVQFEPHTAPRTTDVVFLVEAKSCNEDLPTKKSVTALIQSIDKELQDLNITQNRYAVVVFGGVGATAVPRSVVVNNEIFTNHINLNMFLDPSVIGSKENLLRGDKEGSKDMFDAVAFASKLIFRPGASKTFIMLPCSTCNPKDMKLDYAAINSLLLESGIKLHMLINEEFSFDKVKSNKAFYGIDQVTAYTKKDVNGLIGDKELRDAVRLPKATLGYCSRLALGSNGSLFTGKKMESDKRNPVKKFISVFAKRVASSAAPSACQICECTARDYGTSYSHCYSCDYQTLPNQDVNFMDESSVLALLQDLSFDRDFDSDSSDLS